MASRSPFVTPGVPGTPGWSLAFFLILCAVFFPDLSTEFSAHKEFRCELIGFLRIESLHPHLYMSWAYGMGDVSDSKILSNSPQQLEDKM